MFKFLPKILICLPLLLAIPLLVAAPKNQFPHLKISENGRFFKTSDGKPFFWLADTGWLLLQKSTRAEVEIYLEDRHKKGFNVIQMMVIHGIPEVNAYGDSAFISQNMARPKVTDGADPADSEQYDYWDHLEFILTRAHEKNIYLALVPAWGSVVKSGFLSKENVASYTEFLTNRFGSHPNIIWLTGGDIRGDVASDLWHGMGKIIRQNCPRHLITFHPFGRTQSSTWFHQKDWLDFNMFQSGHRRYDQRRDTDDSLTWYGEDNWRYVQIDWAKRPTKPTLDGEPSYEGIPQGLHDPAEPYWRDRDARRYAWWSVFAGACGHTYGNSAIMQMYKPDSSEGVYGVREFWDEALHAPGASQMQFLKKLLLSRPYFERIPDQTLVAGEAGEKYDRICATRGEGYAFFYTYTGRNFHVKMGKITGETVSAFWYNPRTGLVFKHGEFPNKDIVLFDPPDQPAEGNDWVLILDDATKTWQNPGDKN